MKSTARILLSALLALLMLSLLIIPAAAAPGKIVTFADPELETAMRSQLDIPTGDITQSDLRMLTSFSWDAIISDFAGIEYCTNLDSFELHTGIVNSLAPLAKLNKLNKITLYACYISDISFISKMTSLRSLIINGNHLTDLSPLAKLTNLETLILGADRPGDITDISPLAGLTKLQTLYLNYNQELNDISPLVKLINLHELSLLADNITDITALVNNKGIGSGDIVDLTGTDLDLTPGSPDMVNIQTLIDRGVTVNYSN